jgi:hypothetical protein
MPRKILIKSLNPIVRLCQLSSVERNITLLYVCVLEFETKRKVKRIEKLREKNEGKGL